MHRREIRAHFGDRCLYRGAPVFDHPMMLIAFTNRCGSNLLGEYLRQVPGLAGFGEHFNLDAVRNYSTVHGIDSFPDYIRHLAGTGRQFGFKASADQIEMLHDFGIFGMYRGVRAVHITRTDMLAQAVSYSIAFQTRQWTSEQKAQRAPRFDRGDIRRRLRWAETQNARIAEVLQRHEIETLRVTYEDLVADPLAVVAPVARFFGVEAPASLKPPRIRKQATDLNEEFIARYRRGSGPVRELVETLGAALRARLRR